MNPTRIPFSLDCGTRTIQLPVSYGLRKKLLELGVTGILVPLLSACGHHPRAGMSTAPAFQSMTINVKEFGATGDGISDDTRAINDALSALKAGQTLHFPLGAYKYAGPSITPPDGVSLTGDDTGSRRSHIMAGIVFGSDQRYRNLLFGKYGYLGLTHKNNHTSTHTVFENCRFRGGGPNGSYWHAVAQFGGKSFHRNLSHVAFNHCEFERNLGDWISPTAPQNTVSLWEDNRAGYSHIEYLTFLASQKFFRV